MKSELIINKNPKSLFSESIKTIRTNLAFSSLGKELKVIINTSPEAGDGKSFISANLAIAYAQEGKKVLLVDADLRKGRQHEIFNIMNVATGGYSNLILNYSSTLDINDYIRKTSNENVDLIPTGPTPPNPVELLGSDKNKELIQLLRKKYDIIILDCPPVIGLSDVLVMGDLSDVNMITVSNGKTKFESLERAKKQLEQAGIKINGVIVNKANVKSNHYYSYYTNDYYYGSKNN